jgi:hypothetical protein
MVATAERVRILTGGLILAAILMFPQTTFATKGREAVGMCIDSTASGARCAWSVNDKGEIDICNKNGCVTCPGADKDCKVTRTRPKPTRSIPVGASVTTALGTFTVTPRVYTGSLADIPADKLDAQNAAAEKAPKAAAEKSATGQAPGAKAPAGKTSVEQAPSAKK